jgi:hypothetical protein
VLVKIPQVWEQVQYSFRYIADVEQIMELLDEVEVFPNLIMLKI